MNIFNFTWEVAGRLSYDFNSLLGGQRQPLWVSHTPSVVLQLPCQSSGPVSCNSFFISTDYEG